MYEAPVDDYKFVLDEVIGLDKLMSATGHNEISIDLVEAVLSEAGKLAADVIAPLNHPGDQTGATRHDDASVTTPVGFADAFAAMAEGGWTSMEAREEFGGQQLPMVVTSAVNEFWQAANMAFALCHLLTQGQIYALQKSASAEHQKLFIPPMVEGRWTGTMNLTEPQSGTDLASIKTKAVKNGDHYLITGQKIYITYGEHDMAENIVHLVLARTEDAPPGIKGISVFIVPKFLPNDDGSLGAANDLRCLSIEKKLGIKASPTAVMQYGENGGAIGYLVGAENQGLDIMFGMMNHARLAVGLQGLSISDRAYQQARAYAFDRVQGTPLEQKPGAPIVHHPDVLRSLATMKAEIEAMRALMMLGAASMDLAHDCDSDDPRTTRANLLIPIIKGWMTERALDVTSQAVQVHGGMGFIEETGAAQHFRDARILPIYEGTTAIQANDLVFRKTLRDNGAAVTTLFDEIEAEMQILAEHTDDNAAANARQMISAVGTAREATAHILAAANDPRRPAVNGVNYLMMLGRLCGGWMMARAGGTAASRLSDTSADTPADPAFMQAKMTTSRVFMTHHLPQVQALAAIIMTGDSAVLGMDAEWL
jgi:alkylation response protein AidB-like acyl-CoA dehydrogenase